jgi:hypothetical protein
VAAEVDHFVGACAVDEGGDLAQVPARRRALLEYRARVHRRIVQLDAALELKGMIDGHGKLRSAWLTRLEGLIGIAISLDRLLGFARHEKQVETIDEWKARIAREHDDPDPDTDSTNDNNSHNDGGDDAA